MSNAFTKITPEDLRNKGVVGLPDAPQMTVPELQAKFDEIATDVIVPKFNNLVDEITTYAAGSDEGLADEIARAKAAEDAISDDVALLSQSLTDETTRAEGIENQLATSIEVLEEKKGDMFKATYDQDRDGIVDNASRLLGFEASHFANYQDLQTTNQNIGNLSDLQTTDKSSIVAAINEAAQTGSGGGGEDAEAWAVGQRDGHDVPASDPTYHNNAKYYSQQASASASDAEEAASDASDIKDEISEMIEVAVFTVDFTTGELLYSGTTSYVFTVNQSTGNLEWEVA